MSPPAAFPSLLAAGRALADARRSGRLTTPDGLGLAEAREGRLVAAWSGTSTLRLAARAVAAGLLAPEDQSDERAVERLAPAAATALRREQLVDALLEIELSGRELTLDEQATPTTGAATVVEQPLAEVERRARAWPGLAPLLERAPAPADAGAVAEGLLPADQRALLAAADGARTGAELARALGYGRFELALLLARLVEAGALAVDPAPPVAGPEAAEPGAAEPEVTEPESDRPRDEIGHALDEALAFLEHQDEPPPGPRPPER